MKLLRSELRFASFLTYSPRAGDPHKRIAQQLKEGRMVPVGPEPLPMPAYVARRLEEVAPAFLPEFLGPSCLLVPVPRSGLHRSEIFWPALQIAHELARQGFGAGVSECLLRRKAVRKAAYSAASERPKVLDHFESLEILQPMALPAKVTLVDDVVTRGAQLLGAANRIWAVRPDVEVCAFAVIRTISNPEDFTSFLAPCEGTIRSVGEHTKRRP